MTKVTGFLVGVRCLRWAARWFDRATVHNVIEPLVADWQREWHDAADAPLGHRLRVAIGGGWAFVTAVSWASIRALAVPPPLGAVWVSGTAFGVALAAAALSMAAFSFGSRPIPLDIRLYFAIPLIATYAFAPAALPALMLLARDKGSGRWQAIQVILVLCALSVALSVGVVPTIASGLWLTAEQNERLYQQAVARERAGRFEYPFSAVRQLRPTTPEARASQFAKYKAWAIEQARREPPASPRVWFARFQPALMIVVFGALGWALARLAPPTALRAAGWWAFVWMFYLAPPALNWLMPGAWRVPEWPVTLLFVAAALSAQLATRLSTSGDPITR